VVIAGGGDGGSNPEQRKTFRSGGLAQSTGYPLGR
jgi:hypothetical protein